MLRNKCRGYELVIISERKGCTITKSKVEDSVVEEDRQTIQAIPYIKHNAERKSEIPQIFLVVLSPKIILYSLMSGKIGWTFVPIRKIESVVRWKYSILYWLRIYKKVEQWCGNVY